MPIVEDSGNSITETSYFGLDPRTLEPRTELAFSTRDEVMVPASAAEPGPFGLEELEGWDLFVVYVDGLVRGRVALSEIERALPAQVGEVTLQASFRFALTQFSDGSYEAVMWSTGPRHPHGSLRASMRAYVVPPADPLRVRQALFRGHRDRGVLEAAPHEQNLEDYMLGRGLLSQPDLLDDPPVAVGNLVRKPLSLIAGVVAAVGVGWSLGKAGFGRAVRIVGSVTAGLVTARWIRG